MPPRQLSAFRYATTYLVLLRQFAVDRGWRFWGLLAAVLANAFIHPIPYLLIAEILRSTQAGSHTVLLGWKSLSAAVQPDLGVLLIFLAGAGSFLLSYLVGRLMGREIVAWQGAMFWQLMSRAGRMARWDKTMALGGLLQPQVVASRIDMALRAAFPIGRLIETGLRDFVMILALGGLLIWQDARDTAVLAMLSLLFLPAYAVALSQLVRKQSKSNAQIERWRQPVTELLKSDVTRRSGQAADAEAVPQSVTDAISQGYGSQSHLLNEQNAVSVVAGIHVFAAFYGVYLSEGQSLSSLPASKLSSLFFLILLLRSLTGLIGLVSRLSRGYERLGLLRLLMYPPSKPLPAGKDGEPGRFTFSLPAAGRQQQADRVLGPGDCIVFLAPDVHYSFQLLPLSNALFPRFAPDAGTVTHIPLLVPEDLPQLLANGVIAGEPASLKLPLKDPVPLRPDPVDLAAAPVVALAPLAWRQLVAEGKLDAANQGRLLILAVPGQLVPSVVPKTAWVVSSDGKRLAGAGEMVQMREKLMAMADQKSAPESAAQDEEEPSLGEV